MYLSLLIVFLFISFILITLGLQFREHTELALIGFVFLFLISFIVIANDIDYKVGENLTYHCVYNNGTVQADAGCGTNSTLFPAIKTNTYAEWDGSGTFSHLVGYWLGIISVIGFVAVLVGLRGQWPQ